MKTLWAIAGLLGVLVLWIGISAGFTDTERVVNPPATSSHAEESGMLASDMAMLDSMRASVSPAMTPMISRDPMWTDPDMIRAQEEYQAQLDRMLGKRPGLP